MVFFHVLGTSTANGTANELLPWVHSRHKIALDNDLKILNDYFDQGSHTIIIVLDAKSLSSDSVSRFLATCPVKYTWTISSVHTLDAVFPKVSESTGLVYPVTTRAPVVDKYPHGAEVVDPYRWLEDPDSKETKEWVDQQNKLTHNYLEKCPSRDKFLARMQEMQNYYKYSCPFRRGKRYFFFQNDGLQNHFVLYKQDSLEAKESVLLDPNLLSADGTAALGAYAFSESGALLAFGVQRSGSDWVTIEIKKVDTAENLTDKLEWVKFSNISWTHDDKGFFYSRYPKPRSIDNEDAAFKRGSETDEMSHQSVYYHIVGQKQEQDVEVFLDAAHAKWMYGAEVTDDGKYVLLTISESTDPVNRLYLAPTEQVLAVVAGKAKAIDWTKLVDTFDAEYSYVCNDDGVFYFKTNKKSPNYKIIKIDITARKDGAPVVEVDVLPQSSDVLQYVVAVHKDRLVACYMHDVKEILKLFDLTGRVLIEEYPLPSVGSITGLTGRRQDSEFFYKFSSFLFPGVIYRVDLATTTTSVFREIAVKGFKPDMFQTKQVFFTSKDGTKVPMFIVSRKDVKLDGSNPTLLYGYGGFSISLSPDFSVFRLVFVQHFNGVFAVPNIRGGGEYGEDWHKAGTLLHKQNVFDDFHAAADYLVAQQYTTPARLAIQGGSNGGLLVGACINQRPELYGCALAQVGVMDMLRFHKFTIGYAWCSDYGCSDNKEQYDALVKYSPVHNVSLGKPYPATMLTTADHDDRVVPLHSFKYISELQYKVATQTYQTAPLIIRIDVKAGHGGGKPLAKQLEEQADMLAFMCKSLQVTPIFA